MGSNKTSCGHNCLCYRKNGGLPSTTHRFQLMPHRSSIWGHHQFSFIYSIDNKAYIHFLVVSKPMATAAVQRNTGLEPPIAQQ